MNARRALTLLALVLATAACTAAAAPPAAAPPDRLMLVRAGIAIQHVFGESVPVTGELVASIEISPIAGARHVRLLRVVLSDRTAPVSGATVRIGGHMLFMDHGAFQVSAAPSGDGAYVTELPFAMSGEWQLDIDVRAGERAGAFSLELDEFD